MRRSILLLALTLALSACAHLPASTHTLRQQAERAYAAADYGQAAAAYEALVEEGGGAEEWFRLGNAYVELDRPVEAAAAFRAALERDPKHARARHNLGLVYLQLGVTTLLDARLALPKVDQAAAATMRYLACIMETFLGQPDPVTCRDPAPQGEPQ